MISASMATHPPRIKLLQRAVASLLPQVDRLNVYLNGYRAVPKFLNHKKITSVLGARRDFGDLGKLYWCEKVRGYHLTVDDDILYPPDYAKKCREAVDRYDRKAIIGVHGYAIKKNAKSYYRDRAVYIFSRKLGRDVPVHGVGTGTMSYHTDLGYLSLANALDYKNMSDIYILVEASRRKTPVICMAREAKWLVHLPGAGVGSLFTKMTRNDKPHSALLSRGGPWLDPGSRL